MARSAALTIRILSDVADAQRGLSQTTSSLDKFQGGIDKAALGVGAAFALIGKPAIDAASAVEQAFGGAEAVFGDYADVVKERSREASDAVGLSADAYAVAATQIGGQLRRMGADQRDAADQSDEMIQVAADLAATYGGTTADAVAALGAAFRGEADPAERFNLNLKDSAVKAKIAEQAAAGLTFATEDAARAAALQALIMEQAGPAMGQFGREADSAAGAQQIATAEARNAAAALGEALLPAVVAVAGALRNASKIMTANQRATRTVVTVVAALGAAVLATSAALRVYRVVTVAARVAATAYRVAVVNVKVATAILTAATRTSSLALVRQRVVTVAATAASKAARVATVAWAVAQKVLNAVLRSNPIGIVITLLAALAAGLVTAYRKSETFRRIVDGAFRAVAGAVRWVVDAIADLVGWISRIRWPSPPSWMRSLGNVIGLSTSMTAGPGTAAASRAAGLAAAPGTRAVRTSRGGPTVTVTGAANPQLAARELARLLSGAQVRTGWKGVA